MKCSTECVAIFTSAINSIILNRLGKMTILEIIYGLPHDLFGKDV